ncbi:MAG: hypothetical protein D6689_18455 [Deltaproteobacteria bacterium]|nr:MAG: hypothetical protein D6689_18455 [Deltaproteobacteria bacterium]
MHRGPDAPRPDTPRPDAPRPDAPRPDAPRMTSRGCPRYPPPPPRARAACHLWRSCPRPKRVFCRSEGLHRP